MTFRRVFSKAYTGYKTTFRTAFSKYLFYTNVLLSMAISTVGDLLEQAYEVQTNQIENYHLQRTAHMTFSGATTGVISHYWYIALDKIIIGKTFDMAIKKLLLDQLISSPILILSFFATVAIFEDHPTENFSEEVRDKFWILYRAEWVVWPPAQIINFYYVPTRFRVAYDNTISLCYDVYTSRVKHAKSEKEAIDSKIKENRGS